jgi:hypothetical protein
VETTNQQDSGASQLYYALETKMVEMAQLLNATNLKTIDIADPKDKTFERIKVLWDSAAKVAEASKSLGQTAGILKMDERPEDKKPFVETIAESRK